MSRRLLLFLAALGAVLAFTGTAWGGTISGQYIVVVKSGYDGRVVARDHARYAGADVLYTYGRALNGYAARLTPTELAAVRSDTRVAYVSADRTVHAVAQTLPTGVNRIQGDVSSTVSGNGSGAVGTAVAVIDTGIDASHPDLNVAGGYNCSSGPRSKWGDGNGHGTHVAGTIAAKDDANGVVGMAPGAPLYAVRVLNAAGSGSWSSVICGINWVTTNAASKGIKVANMSLGGSGSDGSCSADALHQAICNSVNAGVTYVVAAGNDNANFSGFVPAAYDQVLTVTAVADFNGAPGGGAAATCRSDVDDTAADFSNYTTSTSADAAHTIAAPGVCILSAWKGGGYNTISGTSMASPHVAGTAALCLWSGGCSGTPSQVMAKLRSDAAAQPSSYGFTGVSGRYYGSLVYAGGY
jgi:subtilisin family serine protease